MQVVDVEVDRDEAVTITYDDGVVARFPVAALRRACPCAGCRGAREAGREPGPGDGVTVVDAELRGNFGLAIRWSDGHDTGIYGFEHLRAWWDAHAGDA
jgi:DUF971 family protein